MPDDWMAIHSAWGYIEVTDHAGDMVEEAVESAPGPVEDPALCPEEPASSTWIPRAVPKGRNPMPKDDKDPHLEDEFDKAA